MRKARRDTIPAGQVIAGGLVTLALLAALAFLALRSPREVPLLGFRTVFATLPETGNLRVHSEVRANGVRVGEVTEVAPVGGRARVRMKLDPGTRVPDDTRVAVRGKGLLGARFVDLHVGTSPTAVGDEGRLSAAADPNALSVSDALSTFDAETRGGLRSTLNELGAGVLGRGADVNRIFEIAPVGGRATIELDDAIDRRPGAVRRLVPGLASASEAIDRARGDIAGGFDPTERALRPFVDRREAVRAAIDLAPGTLAAAEPALIEGRELLGSARSLLSAAAATLPKAPGGLREVTALLRESPRPLARTRGLLQEVGPTVPAVLRITRALAPLLPRLEDGFETLTPLVTRIGRYSCDLIDLGDNWRSVLNQGVPGGSEIGPLTSFRITAMAGTESIAAFGGNAPGIVAQEPFSEPCTYSTPPTRYELGGAR